MRLSPKVKVRRRPFEPPPNPGDLACDRAKLFAKRNPMSTTIQSIDARGYLIGWLKGLTGMYSADINAIPDDKWTATFGGCTRPANELTAEGISLLMCVCEVP